MIFGLIRIVIWLAGVAVIAYFLLPFVGYRFNWDYFQDRKVQCEKIIRQCQSDLVKTGIEGAKENCPWKCVDPKLLIRKEEKSEDSSAQ